MSIRIEQVATPSTPPNRRTRRRLPHNLADVRRLAAQTMLRSGDEPSVSRPLSLARRSTSCLALAVAALAIPTLPSPASAAASPAAAAPVPAAQARHHLPPLVFPDPGAVTFQAWAAAGWSLTPPSPAVDPRCLEIPHHHRCTPWLYQPDAPIAASGPVSLDHRSPVIETLPIAYTSPQKPGGGFSDLPRPVRADHVSGDAATVRAARARTVSAAAAAVPAWAGVASLSSRPAQEAAASMRTPCLRAAHLVGKDRHMLARLRPAADAMGVVVSHRRAACTATVDYLSQARA